MELEEFIELCEMESVSDSALLKQREKLNPEVFNYLNESILQDFYQLYPDEVKTFKGFIVLAIDGRDWVIPNTPQARETFGAAENKSSTQVARIKVSTCFDLFNCFVIDTQLETYKFSELTLAKRHLTKAKELVGDFPTIRVMDRGYISLSNLYYSLMADDKFVIRLASSTFKAEQAKMTKEDEGMEIEYQYDRIRYYKNRDPELYQFYQDGNTLTVRLVKVLLETGETEILMTNLSSEEFSTQDIVKLYQWRWGIMPISG